MREILSPYHILTTVSVLLLLSLPPFVFSQELPAETSEQNDGSVQPSQIYVDQVIDEKSLARELEAEEQIEGVIAPGWSPGAFGVTYRYYNNDADNSVELTEHGVELRGRQETQEHGSYHIQIDGIASDGYESDYQPDGYRIQVGQNNFVLNNHLQLDSDLIHYRTVMPRLITESYRFRLPSTILQGMGNRVYDNHTTMFLNFGEIGRYEGVAARTYETTRGSLQGLGAEHRFNSQWDAAFQIWNTQDPALMESHRTLAAAVQHQRDPFAQNHQLHFLSDSNGKAGIWYDNRLNVGKWQHRAGVQYLPPDLQWTDVAINNDRQGIYWQGDRSAFRWLWNLGTEVSKNNLDDDPIIPGYISTASFANVTWQFRRNTQFGGSVNLQTNTADSGAADRDSTRHTYKAFVGHLFPIGRTRIEPQLEVYDAEPSQTRRYGIRWDQDWLFKWFDRLNSNTQYTTSRDGEDDFNFQIYVEKYLPLNLSINGSFQQYYARYPEIGVTNASTFSMGVGWQFFRNWLLSLDADYNTGSFDPEDGSETKLKGTKILFAVSYNIDTGSRRSLYGDDTGEPGRGRIVGRVFLDENKNGYYDLGEEALSGITVYLDGRFSTETGPKGLFEFWPVASGDHHIVIALQDVPLPWGLLDEAPRRIVVPVRGEAEFNFSLVRINE